MPANPPARTRFICTIGPASMDPALLQELAGAGMGIARVNGSHGSVEDVRRMVAFIQENLPPGVEILLDLPGNKIRTDNLEAPVILETGQDFVLKAENLTYPPLYTRLRPGARISAADGAIQLEVTDIRGTEVHTHVLVGGTLENRKGINVRGIHDALPFDFERDINLLNTAVDLGVDYLGLSFVRSDEHVRRMKAQLVGTGVRVVAKVETAEAVRDLERILDDADMIMVDRGDLEAEIGRENVPLTTKRVVSRARERGVPVIVASQFLTSMMHKAVPYMAEVSDVANAVLDGADVLMLSEETAVGEHPVACISTMRQVAATVEKGMRAEYQVVILAAGPSSGFGSLTANKHKSMLDVGGTTIIRHQLENLKACGLSEQSVTVVTGYNHRQIEHYLRGEGFQGSFVHNPWYMTSNMLVSLWLARPRGNLLLLYGDIIFDRSILVDLLATPGRAVLAVDPGSEMTPEDEKVVVEDGLVVRGGKELDPAGCHGEFIGLARFESPATKVLMQELDAALKTGDVMLFSSEILQRLAARGLALQTCSTEGRPWSDNDCLADLDRSRQHVHPRILEGLRAPGDRQSTPR